MADKIEISDRDSLPKLEDLCLKFIRANVVCWKPENFLGIPRPLLFPLLEKLHPFEIEKVEVSGVFQSMGAQYCDAPPRMSTVVLKNDKFHSLSSSMPVSVPLIELVYIEICEQIFRTTCIGDNLRRKIHFQPTRIDTNPLWRDMYTSRWPRKRKWPKLCFKMKGMKPKQEQWRIYYLQRHLQEAINRCKVTENCSPSQGIHDVQQVVSVCGKYATYLRLHNPAVIYLAKNQEICLQLAEYIEFLEVFLLRDCGVDSLCHLLQEFAAKKLKSVSFCFCKVDSPHMWSKIARSLSPVKYQLSTHADNLEKNSTDADTCETNVNVYGNLQVCEQLARDHDQDTGSSLQRMGQANGDSLENFNSVSCENVEDLDIYDFLDDGDDSSCSGCKASSLEPCSELSADSSSDLYEEIFASCNSQVLSVESPGEPSDPTNQQQLTDLLSIGHQCLPTFETPHSPFTSFSNPQFPLVHLELVGFWLHQYLLKLLLSNLMFHCLNLESLTLQDNKLGFSFTSPALLQDFIDTFYFLCTKGRLQSLEITNNLKLYDNADVLLIEKLVASLCSKCSKNCKSLTKLKFSTFLVSEAFWASVGRAITDECLCGFKKCPHRTEIPDSSSCKCESETDLFKNKDVGLSGCSEMSLGEFCEFEGCQDPCDSSVSSANSLAPAQADCKTKEMCIKVLDSGNCRVEEKRTHGTKSACGHVNWGDNTKTPGVSSQESHVSDSGEMPVIQSNEHFFGTPSLFFGSKKGSTFVGIQELWLSCPLGFSRASVIAEGLQRNSTLQSLSLVNCGISTAGLADIFQALSGNKGNRFLKHLNVKGNDYNCADNDSLAEMLMTNNTITELNLSSCNLGEFTNKFIHALCMNSSLSCLKVQENRLGDSHIAALCQVFSHPSRHSRISKLDLRNNPIPLECLPALASSLQCIKPRKLDELKLTGNILGPKPHQVLSSLRSVVRSVIAEHLDKSTLFADFISQM